MDYPEEVLTHSKKGKIEVRALVDSGTFVRYEYLDPETGARSESKLKLVMHNGTDYEEYFIIPLKQKNKFLLVKAEKKGNRGIYHSGKALDLYTLLNMGED